MTVIAALQQGNEVWIGSNTGYTIAHDSVIDNGEPPWVFFQDWAIGFTGLALPLQACRNHFRRISKVIDSETEIVQELNKALEKINYGVKKPDDHAWTYDIWCIIANKNLGIWDLDETFCLGRIPKGTFWSRGSGEKYALGAARALMAGENEVSPKEVMQRSIESSIFNDLFSPGVVFCKTL